MKFLIQRAVVLTVFLSGTTFAMKGVQNRFISQYPDAAGTELDTCETCHSPVVKDFLNQYGLDLRNNNMNFLAVEKMDSDRDGMANGEEIFGKLLPGSQSKSSGVFYFTNRMGNVTFDHDSHIDTYTRGLCVSCHQEFTFPKFFDDKTLVMDTAHDVCKTCHETNGTWAPTDCVGCHEDKRE